MDRVSTWAVAAALGAVLLGGCAGDVEGSPQGCVPGSAVGCQCAPGMSGASSCLPNGSGYDMCRCEMVAAGTGGFSGLGGTGGVGGTGLSGTGGSSGTGGAAGVGGTGVSGTGGSSGTGGTAGVGGAGGSAGTGGNSGAGGAGGNAGSGGTGGNSGTGGAGGTGGTGGENYGAGETGRMVGFTAAHNAVRARIMTPTPDPALPPMRWSTSLAATAQAYANQLANNGCGFQHSGAPGLGENLAFNGGFMSDPERVTEAWAGEEECWTYGRFFQTDDCDMQCTDDMNSNGCGHYTQIVWRNTTQLGCGLGICANGAEIWVCNYTPQGNYINQFPY